MNLTITRDQLTAKSSTGMLSIDSAFECFTLEDAIRPVKIKGLTAIPYGSYEVIVSWSARFKRRLPLLLAVPNFDGIRIHPGNTDADTDGCILVGKTRQKDFIGQSQTAFAALFTKLEAAALAEKIFIHIEAPGASATFRAPASTTRLASVRRRFTSQPS